MGWHARLDLHYDHDGRGTRAHSRHRGPLRVLASLYPEGPAICHHVMVHPPGGLVSGDVLEVDLQLAEGAHAVLTTPGATRFYRSTGPQARQQVNARIANGARLEWMPLETICHAATQAENQLRFALDPGGEMIGWDVLALGLPASGESFDRGQMDQRIELPGVWLERARVDGGDERLLKGPLGWAGHTVLATAWLATGQALPAERREALLDAARAALDASPLSTTAGVTSGDPRVLVVRALAHRVEPAMGLMNRVRAAWRQAAWGLDAHPPRIWST